MLDREPGRRLRSPDPYYVLAQLERLLSDIGVSVLKSKPTSLENDCFVLVCRFQLRR